MINGQHQAIWEGKFTSPYNGQTYYPNSNLLKPTNSNNLYDINRINGERSYGDQVNQALIASTSGYRTPANGGNPATAGSQGLYAITGINNVPTEASLGGRLGFIEAANQGTASVGQRYSVRGHADQVQAIYSHNPATGNYDAFVIGDNSWSPINERWVAAVPSNASQIGFPGGGGSAAGGFGGGGLGGLLNGGFGGLVNGIGTATGSNNINNNNNTNNTQPRPPNPLEQEENRELVQSVCQQFVANGVENLPTSCNQSGISTNRVSRAFGKTDLKSILSTPVRSKGWMLLGTARGFKDSSKVYQVWHLPSIVRFPRDAKKFSTSYPIWTVPGRSQTAAVANPSQSKAPVVSSATIDAGDSSNTF